MPYMKRAANNNCDGTTLDSNNPAVIRRNARERNRVKQVNNGFFNLRQHIPNAIIAEVSNGRRGIGPGADKKLSKVDTLRMATEYIRRLKGLIDEVDNSDASSVSSYGGSSMYSSGQSNQSCSNGSMIFYPNADSLINPALRTPPICSSSPISTIPTCHYNPATFYSNPAQLNCGYPLHQQQLISPVSSVDSYQSCSSIDSTYSEEHEAEPVADCANATLGFLNHCANHLFEAPAYDEMQGSLSSVTDDEELLDYISLWQDE